MVTVTQESLAARISELESGTRSLKEDFALEAYRMLLPHAPAEGAANIACCDGKQCAVVCVKCGKELANG